MKTAADKKRKRAAKQRQPSADRHEAVHEERKLLALQIEYPTSNLEDILSIAGRTHRWRAWEVEPISRPG